MHFTIMHLSPLFHCCGVINLFIYSVEQKRSRKEIALEWPDGDEVEEEDLKKKTCSVRVVRRAPFPP
jgi:hypothetical protein